MVKFLLAHGCHSFASASQLILAIRLRAASERMSRCDDSENDKPKTLIVRMRFGPWPPSATTVACGAMHSAHNSPESSDLDVRSDVKDHLGF